MIAASLLRQLAATPGVPSHSRAQLFRTAGLGISRRLPTLTRPSHPIDASLLGEEVYDCLNVEALPGRLVGDPDNSSDSIVSHVALTTRKISEFWRTVYRRNSLDNKGMTLCASIHFSRSYCNAFWDGERCVFGDGDGLIFKNMSSSIDFVAHEVSHGVTQYTADLDYENEAGALNESMSDVFGMVFRQWALKQSSSTAQWKIGLDMIGPTALELGWICLRDLENPANKQSMTIQPTVYSQCKPGDEVHINSGVPNRAFYIAASTLPWPSWENAGRVWYQALCSQEASSTISFIEFAHLTVKCAMQLYPRNPAAVAAVRDAWSAVEVL
jgi:Zn-dependent metalloprotease